MNNTEKPELGIIVPNGKFKSYEIISFNLIHSLYGLDYNISCHRVSDITDNFSETDFKIGFGGIYDKKKRWYDHCNIELPMTTSGS